MARVSEVTPVDPEVAAALLRSHLGDFFEYSPHVRGRDGWAFKITEDPLVATVDMPARASSSSVPEVYTLRLDATYYDTWPVSATFVEFRDGAWQRARMGTPAFPFLAGSPGAPGGAGVGFEFALHDEYPFPNGQPEQLICFSYNLGYYISNHTPNEDQKWRPGADRLDATLSRIYAALNSPAYLGPSAREAAA